MNNSKETIKILRANDIMEILDVGRDRAYSLLKSPSFPSTKIGKTYFVTDEKFNEWLSDYAGKEFII